VTVIRVDFQKPKLTGGDYVDSLVQVVRGRVAQALSEAGFHKVTSQRVCDLLSECLTERFESIHKELSFVVTATVTPRSAAAEDVAAAVSEAWKVQMEARVSAIAQAAQAAIASATLDAVTLMARSDQL